MAAVMIPQLALDAMSTIADLLQHAGLRGDVSSRANVGGAWLKATGFQLDTPILVLSSAPEEAYNSKIENLLILDDDVGDRVPSLLESAQVALVWRAAVQKGAGPPVAPQPAASSGHLQPQQQADDGLARRAKLNVILSVILEIEVTADATKATLYYSRYEAVYGEGMRPAPVATPSALQLAGVQYLFDANVNPSLDYSVWGPYHYRIMKAMKCQGVTLAADGTIATKELPGPPDDP